ncbi:MAG: CDP-diacylglycerol--serine O-phosphatidyltransferase [Bacillota bacterium]
MKLKVSRRVLGLKVLRQRGRRGLSVLPHLFTVGNLTSGVLALVFVQRGEPLSAAWMIILAMVFDGFDGRVARLLRAEGEFGRQMDSLADVVSFGVAPALMMYQMELHRWGTYGLAVTALFAVSGALRLARFNILRVSGHFTGLPITAGGGLMASLALYGERLSTLALPILMLVVSYLMISTVPYPDFKKLNLSRPNLLPYLLPLLAVVLAVRADPRSLIALPLVLYTLSGPYLVLLVGWHRSVTPWLRSLNPRLR